MACKKKRTGSANGRGGGKWIRPERRLAIYLRDGFRCAFCRRDLHHVEDPRELTLDHLRCGHFPGNHHETNLVTACGRCNSSRQDMPWRRFARPFHGAVERIERLRRRSLVRYRELADSIISGEVADPRRNRSAA